jgi:hypothetical protein
MDAKLVAATEDLRRTAARLVRAGLVIDHATLSPAHRRAFFALQCRMADWPQPERKREPIGFPYPAREQPQPDMI